MTRSLTNDQLHELEQGFASFGSAVAALKKGYKVARSGWNGKGMFLFLVPGSTFKANRAPLLGIYPEGTEINGNYIFLCSKFNEFSMIERFHCFFNSKTFCQLGMLSAVRSLFIKNLKSLCSISVNSYFGVLSIY